MFQLLPDSIGTDTVPFFLKETAELPILDSIPIDFLSFEYVATDSTRIFFDVTPTALTTQSIGAGMQGIPLPFSTLVQSVLALLFLACFLLFALFFSREGAAIMGNFKNVFLSGNLSRETAYKEQITITEIWGEVFLVLQSILFCTIILFVFSWEKFPPDMSRNNYFFFFVGSFFYIAFFIGIKYASYKAIGSFMFVQDMGRWIERYFWIIELLGVLIFLPTLFYVYLLEYRTVALITILIIFILSRIVIITSLLSFFVKNKIGLLYFIVYLCGVEIAPYLFAYQGAVLFIK